MNQKEHVAMIVENLHTTIIILMEKYDIPENLVLERCISSSSIENLILNNENSIYDQLDGIYKKDLKNLFNDLKKINFLGNPRLSYYKDNTIKITSNILNVMWFHGDRDSIFHIINSYLKRLKKCLQDLDFIKYVQYIIDIPGLKLETGDAKLTIEDKGITITYPFEMVAVEGLIAMIKPELEDKKMEIMSSVLLLRQSNNDIYIPQKYDNYYLPEIFDPCLENFYINSVNNKKYVKVFYEGKFEEVFYLSAYEFMNNKINKPLCYFYIKNNKLLDKERQNKINKILRLQDSLE